MLKKYPHSSGDKRRAILRWGTKMVVSTSKQPPPCTPNQQAIANYNKFIANYSKLYPGGPIPHNLARALMPRQPYSVAVLSTEGRLHPRFLRKRGLGRKWSSPCRRDGEVEKSLFLWEKAMLMSAMKTRFQIAECNSLYQQRGTG